MSFLSVKQGLREDFKCSPEKFLSEGSWFIQVMKCLAPLSNVFVNFVGKPRTVVMDRKKGEPVVSVKKGDQKEGSRSRHDSKEKMHSPRSTSSAGKRGEEKPKSEEKTEAKEAEKKEGEEASVEKKEGETEGEAGKDGEKKDILSFSKIKVNAHLSNSYACKFSLLLICSFA